MFKEKIGEAAVYEQLAEEAAELAQAALKVSRILRGENPTPVTLGKAKDHLIEELTDVYVCCSELRIDYDHDIFDSKVRRWMSRIEAAEREKKQKATAKRRRFEEEQRAKMGRVRELLEDLLADTDVRIEVEKDVVTRVNLG